jgi:hypothetical protein
MDRTTAGIVAMTVQIKAPEARIIHHSLFRPDRTW